MQLAPKVDEYHQRRWLLHLVFTFVADARCVVQRLHYNSQGLSMDNADGRLADSTYELCSTDSLAPFARCLLRDLPRPPAAKKALRLDDIEIPDALRLPKHEKVSHIDLIALLWKQDLTKDADLAEAVADELHLGAGKA